MKNSKLMRSRKLAFISGGILLLIGILLLFFAPVAAGVMTATLVLPAIPDLTDTEKKSLEALVGAINAELDKHNKGYISEAKFKELADSHLQEYLKTYKPNEEKLKSLEAALEAQGLELKAIKESGGKPERIKSYREQIVDQLKGKSLEQAITDAPGGKLKLQLKAADVPMTTVSMVPGGSAYLPMPTADAGYDRAPVNQRFIRNYASTSQTSSPMHVWAEKYNGQGQAAFIGEGDLKPAISFSLRTKSTTAKKVGVSAKFTKETLQDIPGFMAELQTDVVDAIDIKEEEKLLNGDGTGDDPLGVIPQATTYVLTTIKTKNANNFDAIKAAFTQLTTLNYRPNICFINPIDSANMELTKASDGHYLLPPFSTADGTVISNVRVQAVNQIPVGKFLLGDFSKFYIKDYVGLEVVLGYENDDFSKGLVTVVGDKRILTYIKEHQKPGFLYGTFATIKAAIEEA